MFRILTVLDRRALFPGGWTVLRLWWSMPPIMVPEVVELALGLVRGIWGCRPFPSGTGFCSEEALLCHPRLTQQSRGWQGGTTNQ